MTTLFTVLLIKFIKILPFLIHDLYYIPIIIIIIPKLKPILFDGKMHIFGIYVFPYAKKMYFFSHFRNLLGKNVDNLHKHMMGVKLHQVNNLDEVLIVLCITYSC